MGLVSSMKGFVKWGKMKGLSQNKVQKLIKLYEKETGINLNSNKCYYNSNQDIIEKSKIKFLAFTRWYANNKNVL